MGAGETFVLRNAKSACPIHEPDTRAERKRLERAVAKARPDPGVGQGWRLTNRGRLRGHVGGRFGRHRPSGSYLVRELADPPSFDTLVSESDAVAHRLGCRCPLV